MAGASNRARSMARTARSRSHSFRRPRQAPPEPRRASDRRDTMSNWNSIWKTLLLGAGGAGIVTMTVVSGQQNRAPATLTAMDYVQIQQLVVKAQYGLYSGAQEGRMYSSAFAPDGTFGGQTGTAALTAYAKNGKPGVRSLVTNIVITPTAQGASGRH